MTSAQMKSVACVGRVSGADEDPNDRLSGLNSSGDRSTETLGTSELNAGVREGTSGRYPGWLSHGGHFEQ
jgi:hypothetical protein